MDGKDEEARKAREQQRHWQAGWQSESRGLYQAELKRDALHVFRRLDVATCPAEKAEICGEAF